MAAAEVATRPQQDRPNRRKPFAQWVKNLTGMKNKNGEQNDKFYNKKSKKGQAQNGKRNNPYPESGQVQQPRHSNVSSANGQLSVVTPQRNGSYGSLPNSSMQDREAQSASNRSGAPTLATNPETVHSDAGHSKAATTTTHGGALSSIDGAGADSTFSSPSQSQHSLSTTLTTIQSSSAGNNLNATSGQPHHHHHGSLNNPNPVMFSHQYPVSPAPSAAISAIPRHITETLPNTYNSATANGLLSDNASIITLASSSKRRRRSMDTDASVRALAPSSVWGGSRESLPLSVLSGNADTAPPNSGIYSTTQSRPSIGGVASTERTSIYSNPGGLASERNSYYSHKPGKGDRDLGGDAKSLRSITNMDARSLNADAKSMAGNDVSSLRNYEGSVRSSRAGHNRNDSTPGSIGGSVANVPGVKRTNTSGGVSGLSRRSSDWQHLEDGEEEGDGDGERERRQSIEEQDVVPEEEREERDEDGR